MLLSQRRLAVVLGLTLFVGAVAIFVMTTGILASDSGDQPVARSMSADTDQTAITSIATSSDELREDRISQQASDDDLLTPVGVRGAWTIDTKDPETGEIERYVFNNILVDDGADVLANVLGRLRHPVGWRIVLGAENSNALPCESRGTPVTCLIVEESTAFGRTPTLNVKPSSSGLVLNGSTVTHRRGEIDTVSTDLRVAECASTDDFTTGCSNATEGNIRFTSTSLRTAIPVDAGQEIDVTVRLTFE